MLKRGNGEKRKIPQSAQRIAYDRRGLADRMLTLLDVKCSRVSYLSCDLFAVSLGRAFLTYFCRSSDPDTASLSHGIMEHGLIPSECIALRQGPDDVSFPRSLISLRRSRSEMKPISASAISNNRYSGRIKAIMWI